MQIEWKGHASFLLRSADGVRVLTDPFNERVGLPLPNVEVDVVTVSHQHGDHNAAGLLPGKPVVIDGIGKHEVSGVEIKGIATYHDPELGAKRGNNTVFVIKLDGLNVCHLGDLGHTLSSEQISEIGPVDVLCVPVGGFYTIDAQQAHETVQQLRPAVVLPMHYKLDDRVKSSIGPVGDFVAFYPKVEINEVLAIDKASISGKPQVVLLKLR